MSKSPDAFRTISEVADWLGIQAHVLRFWESKFTQVKPIKRAGGRRYYRPADMLLLGGIKKLLHDDGLTIKGVQKLLREEGMSHVVAMSPPLEDGESEIEVPVAATPTPKLMPEPEEQSVVLPFEALKEAVKDTVEADSIVEKEADQTPKPEPQVVAETQKPNEEPDGQTGESEMLTESAAAPLQSDEPTQQQVEATQEDLAVEPKENAVSKEVIPQEVTSKEDVSVPAPEVEAAEKTPDTQTKEDVTPIDVEPLQTTEVTDEKTDEPVIAEAAHSEPSAPSAIAETETPTPTVQAQVEPPVSETIEEPSKPKVEAADDAAVEEKATEEPAKALPSFLRSSAPQEPEAAKEPEQAPFESAEPDADAVAEPSKEEAVSDAEALPEPTPSPEPSQDIAAKSADEPEVKAEATPTPPAPKARDIGMPPITPEHEMRADHAMLTGAYRIRVMDAQTAQKAKPLLEQLTALRDRMVARRSGAHPKS